jgi:hypothetical protein
MRKVFKDQFTFPTLLAIGSALNLLLYLGIGRSAFLLAPVYLAIRLVDTILQTCGYSHNALIDEVVPTKVSAQYPSADGKFGSKAADGSVCVFMIGARVNHPLGIFAPGFKKLADYFEEMTRDVEKHADEHDFLGSQHWISDGQRETSNEIMAVMYFKTLEGLHKYAHGPLHREGWNWWNQNLAKHGHIGIWHEVFVAPKGAWETIYINSQPVGFGATHFPVKTESGVEWRNSLVDATRGKPSLAVAK